MYGLVHKFREMRREPLQTGVTAAVAVAAAAVALLSAGTGASAELNPATPLPVAPGVPDQGRAWELVTSPEPVPAALYNARAIAIDGNRVAYMTYSPLSGAPSGKPSSFPAAAERGPTGWTNSPVTVPYSDRGNFPGEGLNAYYGPQLFTPNLDTWYGLRDLGSTDGDGFKATDAHLFRWPVNRPFEDIADLGAGGVYVGASTDTRHIFFNSPSHLLPGDAARTEGSSVYELSGGSLHLVDVADDGSLISECGSAVPIGIAVLETQPTPFAPAVSADGRRVFFSSHPGCGGSARVFLREDGNTTREISASQCDLPSCGPEADVTFVGATRDGAHVFLVTEERLTDDDANTRADLYRYDSADHALTLLSAPAGGPELGVSPVPVYPSVDGSRVYFTAREWDGGSLGDFEDAYLAEAGDVRLVPGVGRGFVIPNSFTARFGKFLQTSEDGRYAVFASKSPLVASDHDESADIYRFDAVAGSLQELSAGGDGPTGAQIYPDYFSETVPSHPYRVISADGNHVFFNTGESLLPEDANQVSDVYEWTPSGLGLISSGAADSKGSSFVGSTPDGSSAFFKTTDTLLPRDRDGGQRDFYVARIGGGFPEPPPPVECAGAGCHSPRRAGTDSGPSPATAGTGTRIEVRQLSATDRRRIVATGRIVVLAEVPAPGRLSAQARARLGRRTRTVAAGGVNVSVPGQAEIHLRLSRPARAALARGRHLDVRLALRLSGLGTTASTRFVLRGSR